MFVYSIDDPSDYIPFYVGITANLYERFKQHMRCDGTNVQKDARIRKIVKAGLMPIMRTIEQISNLQNAGEHEEYWIRYYREQGVQLLNLDLTPSLRTVAQGGRKHTSEQIDSLLRYLVTYGKLPPDIKVSKRTEYEYRHHARLPIIRLQIQAEQKPVKPTGKRLPLYDGSKYCLSSEQLTEVLDYAQAYGRIALGL